MQSLLSALPWIFLIVVDIIVVVVSNTPHEVFFFLHLFVGATAATSLLPSLSFSHQVRI